MAPTPKAPQVKWTQEEVDVLVEMTNHQLELEAQDRTAVISWSSHWKRVSSRLKELGHNRTPTACRGIWRRGVAEQQANREAAGPDWDESEHEILVLLTKKQLDLEKADQSNVIPWAKHWKKVSLQLDESGYVRTPDNCAAYWLLIENDVIDDSLGLGDDASAMDDAEDDLPADDTNEDAKDLHSHLAVTSPQMSKVNPPVWSPEEYESLLRLLKERRQLEADQGLEMLTGSKLWIEITQSHKANGFDRSYEACKTFWNKQGRDRSGYDERIKPSPSISRSAVSSSIQPIAESGTPAIQSIAEPRIIAESSTSGSGTHASAISSANSGDDRSKPSSLSSMWSTVNEAEVEESIVITRNPTTDPLKNYQKDNPTNSQVSGLSSALPKSTGPVAADIEPFKEHDLVQQNKRQVSVNSSTPVQPSIEKSSSAKGGHTSFRFTPEQRAVLEAEALRTGGTLDGTRKVELAQELGVEEKTVRNWFNNYNVKARRSQGSTPVAAVPVSIHKGFDDEFSREPTTTASANAATPTPLNKNIGDFSGVTPKRPYSDDGTPEHRPAKKIQLEAEGEKFKANQQGFNPVNGHSSWHGSQGSSTAALPAQSVPGNSAAPTEERGSPAHRPFEVNRLTNGSSNTPARVIQSSGFTAISKNNTERQSPVPPPSLQLKSTPPELIPRPEGHQPVHTTHPNILQPLRSIHPAIRQPSPRVAEQHPPLPPHTVTAYPSILCENDNDNIQTSSTLTTNNVTATKKNQYVLPKESNASHATSETPLKMKTPEPVASARGSKSTSPTITGRPQTSPHREANQEWARQFAARTEKPKDYSASSITPASTPTTTSHAHAAQPPPTQPEHAYQAPRPFTTPAQTPNSNAKPITVLTPSDEDSKASALRHVENFRADIEDLNKASEARRMRITSLTQELSLHVNKHVELNAEKDAEIARALKDIETKYNGLHLGLRQREQWLEKEKETEVEGLKKNTLEVSKKQKGLVRWQGVVEYYDSEGEEEL